MKAGLSQRQLEVLRLVAAGKSNAQIAQALHITVRTVKHHTNAIYSKIQVTSRAEAVAWAWKNKILEDDQP